MSKLEVQRWIAEASAERLIELYDPPHRKTYAPLVSQEGRLRISTVYMGLADLVDDDKGTHSLDERQLELIEQVARIGVREGYRVIVKAAQTETASLSALEARPWLGVLSYAGPADIWAQDTGDIRTDHTVTVPARVGDQTLIWTSVLRDRLARHYPEAIVPSNLSVGDLKRLIARSYPLANFEVPGRVDAIGSQLSSASMATAERPVHEGITYLEGGDHLVGREGAETYAIVGRDSVAASRALMTRDLHREVSSDEVLGAIAHDLGIRSELLFPVEQPGEFHLDMAMMLLGPRLVVLNDALEAARLEELWLREDLSKTGELSAEDEKLLLAHLAEVHLDAELKARGEALAEADLLAAGFTVHRVAGVFSHWSKRMNLMNMVLGTGEQGDQYGIVFGADPRAEQYLANKLLSEIPGRLQRIHFLSRSVSMPSGTGGIKCRMKPDGVAAP